MKGRRIRAVVLILAAVGVGLLAWKVSHPAPPPAARIPTAKPSDIGAIYQVAPNLYVVPDVVPERGGGNTAVFVTRSGVLLVDSKLPGSWDGLMAQIRTVTDKPITHIVNTHFHIDHVGGNGQLPNVEVVVQDNTARRLQSQPLPGERLPRMRTFTDRLTLFEGDESVDLYYFGLAHTDGDTFVVFRSAGVMHTGDVFPGKRAPTITWEGSGKTYADVVARAAAIPGVTQVIPGHSRVLTADDLDVFADFVRLLTDHVRRNMRLGADKRTVFRSFVAPAAFNDYELERTFATMDEIDVTTRPWWQRIFNRN